MLFLPEKILFIILLVVSLTAGFRAFIRIVGTVKRGYGTKNVRFSFKNVWDTLEKTIFLTPTWNARLFTSIVHAVVVWTFLLYMLVNIGDILEGFIPSFEFLGQGMVANLYHLTIDLFSGAGIVGMIFFILRRLLLDPKPYVINDLPLLIEGTRQKIKRDSLIVGFFILLHVSGRLVGVSFKLAMHGIDPWQPIASWISGLWAGNSSTFLIIGEHVCFWFAIGLILAFIPYFLYSKHIHLIMTPIKFFLSEKNQIGKLEPLDLEDETITQYGAARIEDLSWHQILDGYTCIMCNRCQAECPAYNTGKPLSPAALEINKRIFMNHEGGLLAKGEQSNKTLLEFAVSKEAVFDCTACGACTNICPVGNDPLRDIMDIRRNLVLTENDYPEQWAGAFRGMERNSNPWALPSNDRVKWTKGLDIPTIKNNPNPDILWWVGCAPAMDPRAQKTSVAFTKILKAANVNFSILGELEKCTGDSARRTGNEYLYYQLATANIATLNKYHPKRIVTTCPHCMHTLKNDYPDLGGNYSVISHAEFIAELIDTGRLPLREKINTKISYHDPCYLSRYNQCIEAPRSVLTSATSNLVEPLHHGKKSFCCGGGGAQVWKEETGNEKISHHRMKEFEANQVDILAVACPFCLTMMTDAQKESSHDIKVQDISEIVAEQLSGPSDI